MNINEYREKIDEIDDKIVGLFCERMKLCIDIADYKSEKNLPVLDFEREKNKLKSVTKNAPDEYHDAIRELYAKIFEISRSAEERHIKSGKSDKTSEIKR